MVVVFQSRVEERPFSPKKMVPVRIPSVHSSKDRESEPRGCGSWKTSLQVTAGLPEQCDFRDPEASGVFHTMLSGTRLAATWKVAVTTTGSLEFVVGSVAFWQATRTSRPRAKVARGRRDGRSNFIGAPIQLLRATSKVQGRGGDHGTTDNVGYQKRPT
jgi:hypothetical protein